MSMMLICLYENINTGEITGTISEIVKRARISECRENTDKFMCRDLIRKK